jgi:two-component system cell cycle sensor histidine kinase PleC
MGFSEVIQRQILGPANPKYPEYAADIHHSADHLLSMINEILDHSKLEAGKWRLQESDFAVADWLASTLRVARGRAERAGVVLDIRPPPETLAAYGDERILLQALLNLVANAIKFAGPDRLVAVSCHWALGQDLRIEVRDQGPGMTPAEAAQALRPYESGSATRARSEEGTGLGLPLASSFVALHGGSLTLDSAPGRGTTAVLTLPAARIRVPAAA